MRPSLDKCSVRLWYFYIYKTVRTSFTGPYSDLYCTTVPQEWFQNQALLFVRT